MDLNFEIEKMIAELKQYKNDKQVLIDTCQKMVDMHQSKIEMYKKAVHDKETFIKYNIQNLLDANKDELKETKTELSYKVPSAKIYFKKPTQKLVLKHDYNNQDIPDRFLKTSYKVDWAAYKKILQISGDQVVNIQSGEIVDSVEIEKTDKSELNIKFLEG